jgi:hypothetical protein
MLKSVETASEERLSRKEEASNSSSATTTEQRQQENGVDGKLQIFVWDPGGFPTAERGSS